MGGGRGERSIAASVNYRGLSGREARDKEDGGRDAERRMNGAVGRRRRRRRRLIKLTLSEINNRGAS